MNDHDECGHEHPSEGFYAVELPSWRFSLWEVAGITTFMAAGVLDRVANGLGLFAREFQAMANNSRQTFDLREAERKQAEIQESIAADLRAMVDGSEGAE